MGYCSLRSPSAGAGQQIGVGLNFVLVLSTTPTGLSFIAIASANVGSGPSVTSGTLTPYGCEVTVSAAAAGPVLWTGKYTTVGAYQHDQAGTTRRSFGELRYAMQPRWDFPRRIERRIV